MRRALLGLALAASTAWAQVPGVDLSLLGVDSANTAQNLTLAPVQIGAYTVQGAPVKSWSSPFDRDQDAPDFINFESYQQYFPLKHKFINSGTCYGISMFTLRYFQWFVLPHLQSDAQRAAAPARTLPAYAQKVANDMGLPAWVLGDPMSDGNGGRLTADQRAARIKPYRLRNLLRAHVGMGQAVEASIEKISKDEAASMFDNQDLLMTLGARLAAFIDRTVFRNAPRSSPLGRKLFGVGAFGLMQQYVGDPTLGACEIGFYGSKISPYWGHSVVGFRITQYGAAKKGGGAADAFKIDIYDSNDPTNTADDAVWWFPSENAFAPTKGYADFYDGDNPFLPKGKAFLLSAQLGPSAEQQMLAVERNAFNNWMLNYKTVGETGN